jgi:hypothetical protein
MLNLISLDETARCRFLCLSDCVADAAPAGGQHADDEEAGVAALT